VTNFIIAKPYKHILTSNMSINVLGLLYSAAHQHVSLI